jgi:hypothetical protein
MRDTVSVHAVELIIISPNHTPLPESDMSFCMEDGGYSLLVASIALRRQIANWPSCRTSKQRLDNIRLAAIVPKVLK